VSTTEKNKLLVRRDVEEIVNTGNVNDLESFVVFD
jgi:hypothetical protein